MGAWDHKVGDYVEGFGYYMGQHGIKDGATKAPDSGDKPDAIFDVWIPKWDLKRGTTGMDFRGPLAQHTPSLAQQFDERYGRTDVMQPAEIGTAFNELKGELDRPAAKTGKQVGLIAEADLNKQLVADVNRADGKKKVTGKYAAMPIELLKRVIASMALNKELEASFVDHGAEGKEPVKYVSCTEAGTTLQKLGRRLLNVVSLGMFGEPKYLAVDLNGNMYEAHNSSGVAVRPALFESTTYNDRLLKHDL